MVKDIVPRYEQTEPKKKPYFKIWISIVFILIIILSSVYFFWFKKEEEEIKIPLLCKTEFLPKCKALLYDDISLCFNSNLSEKGVKECKTGFSITKAVITKDSSYCEGVADELGCKFFVTKNLEYCPKERKKICIGFLNFDPTNYKTSGLSKSEKEDLDDKLTFYAVHNKDLDLCKKINNSMNSFRKQATCLIVLSKVEGNFCEKMLIKYCESLPEGFVIGDEERELI